MTLSLVIPVWNDPDGLVRLLKQVVALDIFEQIIVSDDASVPAKTPESLNLGHLKNHPGLLWLRSDAQRGAGHARNMALRRVTGEHVIFFDSDDLFLPEFADLLAEIESLDFDFCIFRHVDSRMRAEGNLAPLTSDDALWKSAGAMTAVPTALSLQGAKRLCRISAYPWNKVYRTGFLREANIRCTEIPVHNDLELHWMSFMKARRILTSKRVCCEHFVEDRGTRLTNRTGAERFEVFQALEALHDELEHNPHRLQFLEPFTESYVRLFKWIMDTLEPELRASFAVKVRQFLLRRMTVPLFTLIALRNPGLGARINQALAEGLS